MRGVRTILVILMAAASVAAAAPAEAELRLSDLAVYLNDHEVTVHVVALGAVPAAFHEPIQSGIPAHMRFTIELWQYNRLRRDHLLTRYVVERLLSYNVVAKEYRVAFQKGETRATYATRDVRDAQRVISEVRAIKLSPPAPLEAHDVIYVRVYAEAALNGENSFVARMAGTAEETELQSEYRTLRRVQ
ncbi:MAG: DUF4390 domain-containing protein [Candidatus Rokuibacteriota bacterium]